MTTSTSHHPLRRSIAGLGGLALVLGLAGTAPATAVDDSLDSPDSPAVQPYDTIQLQARTNLLVNDEGFNLPPGSSFNSITTDINDEAHVAFPVQVATFPGEPTRSTAAIWLGHDGEGDLVYRAPENLPISPRVHMNDADDIVFTQSGAGVDNKIWLYDGASGEAAQVDTFPLAPTSYSVGGIDEAANIGFQGTFSGDRAHGAVIDGETHTYVRDQGLDPDSPYSYLYTVSFNDTRQIASKVSLVESFNHQEVRIWEADGSSVRVLATNNVDPDSPYRAFDNGIGLSDAGVVAAMATRIDTGRKVLVRADGTTVEEIADLEEDSPLGAFDYFAPDINAAGEVVFRAREKDGTQGVWVADGTSLTRVLAQGDVVETDRGAGQVGQHDTSPVFGGSPSINNHGDISLTAALHPEGDRMVEWGTGVFIAYSGSEGEEPPTGPESVERVEGRDRYETAAAAALQVYEAGVPAVYVASGDDYPDALTGAALAGSQDSPVLLTRSDLLPSATRAALTALAPQRIVVLGGSDSIEDDRLTELEAYTQGTVTRIGGEHRYETAALVAAELADSSTVYVATGLDYPDALAAAARAGAGDNPVLLVTKERIPAHTAGALDALAPDRIVLLGDEDSVVGAVAESLAEYAPVERVAGANRYETAALLSQTLTGSVYAYVATGEDWPDALAGAAVAAHLDAPVLLTRSDLVPSATVTELERLKAPHLRVLGGETVVHPSVITELLALDYTG